MIFSSATFLFLFLPVFFLLHLVLPGIKTKNILLVVASLLFYAWGEGIYVLLMIISVFLGWLAGILIAKYDKYAKAITAISVILNIGMLFVYKYAGFFVEIINYIPGIEIPAVTVRLPLGISFFTFQILSYVIDVYRDRSIVNKSYFSTLLYISFFPQLIAGPIVKYHDINLQIESRKVTAEGAAEGIRRFIIGLSKKLLIADVTALAVDSIFALETGSMSGACAWLGAILYIFQIYFDFSGYSDMAIGLGQMFGFKFKENFNYPYVSLGIRDFWRRWHISLSTWFREYLYISLGGNRKGNVRTYVNLFIVFLATGLWHGANFTFLVWGIYNGILIVLERAEIIKIKNKVLCHIYTTFAVIIGFVIFRADSLSVAFSYIGRMFTPSAYTGGFSDALSFCTPYLICTVIFAIVCCLPVLPYIKGKMQTLSLRKVSVLEGATYVLVLLMLFVCIMVLAANTYSPFIYFRF